MFLVHRESGRNDVQWMEEIEADLKMNRVRMLGE